VILSDYATLMVEILKDNARQEAGAVYGSTCPGRSSSDRSRRLTPSNRCAGGSPVVWPDPVEPECLAERKIKAAWKPPRSAVSSSRAYSVPQDFMIDAIKKANVDLVRLNLDANRHSDDIVKLLKKNMAVAQRSDFKDCPRR
jgi:hypothetical protein